MIRYAFGPLAEAMRCTEAEAGRHLAVSGSTLQGYQRVGMSERVADRLACKAGWNPSNIWPEFGAEALEKARQADEALMVPCADERCEAPFVPSVSWQRFCSPQCRKRKASRERERRRYADDAGYRARKQEAVRVYRAEVGAAAVAAERRRHYQRTADLQRAKRRARYWANPEREREAMRRRRAS